MPNSTRSVRILLSASEAYPALERAFLGAYREIWASFLVFDLTTRLRSPEAQAIGKTWFDLVVHTLNRGVSLHILISDADPIARAAMHRAATRNLRMFSAAAATAKPGVKLHVLRPRHPAQTGALVRLAIWPYAMQKLFKIKKWLNGLNPACRTAALRDMDRAERLLLVRPDGTVTVRLWSMPRLFPVVHHQKLAVFDRRALYIGGLDLDERRYTAPTHQRVGNHAWHDVQLMIEGPIVAEAQQHLETFQTVIDGSMDPPRTRRLLRTISRPHRGSLWHYGPELVVGELWSAHLILSQRAKNLIYMESQFFRDIRLARALAETARRTPGLKMILILPAAPDGIVSGSAKTLDIRFTGTMQATAISILRSGFKSRLFVGSPAQPPALLPDGETGKPDQQHRALQTHVHAKVSIFDDTSAIVSSANLSMRGLRWDTEAGVYLTNENDVIELRYRVMAHWLPNNVGSDALDGATAMQAWARIAWRNASKPHAERDSYLLPHTFAAAEAFGRKQPTPPPQYA